MRFAVDNQLPPLLARFLQQRGHDAVHVMDVALDAADDRTVWAWTTAERRVMISKMKISCSSPIVLGTWES